MALDEELKRLDDEIGLVIAEIEELKHRMIRDWKTEKTREIIKKEIKEINDKIQKIFTRIIELTQD